MADDVDAMHEMSIAVDCTGVDDIALHCVAHVLASRYLPSQDGHMTWIAEADSSPFAVVVRAPRGEVTITRVERHIAIEGNRFALFFSYHRQRDPKQLLAEIQAGHRPRQ